MDISIKSKTKNPFLSREEVICEVTYLKEPTPDRKKLKTALAKQLGTKENLTVINYIRPSYGKQTAVVRAHLYKNEKQCKEIEKKYLLARDGLIEVKKKEEPEEKAETKPEEKPKVAEEKPKVETEAEPKPEADKGGEEEKGAQDQGQEGKEEKTNK
jgi:ribosomal protein S24E